MSGGDASNPGASGGTSSGMTWMPPGSGAAAPAGKMSERMSPEAMGGKFPFMFLAFWSQALGLLLLLVGALIAVIWGVVPTGCFTSSCSVGSTAQGVDNAIIAARALWVLGLFGLGVGAAIHLQWRPMPAAGASPEEVRLYVHRRWGETILLLLSIVLLFLIFWLAPTFFPAPV